MKLILLGLPIGNAGDVSSRAIRTLSEAKLIICEDTRVLHSLWQKLMNIGLAKEKLAAKVRVINDFNEKLRVGSLVAEIAEADEAVLVSDAGMPVISDPGYNLVKGVLAAGGEISVVPGPDAAMSAVAVSGFPADKVMYLGFLPKKTGKRRQTLEMVKQLSGVTVVIYEGPGRIVKLIDEVETIFGEVEMALCNDLTKVSEKVWRGKTGEVKEKLPEKLHGEWVVVARI